jgi:F-type H+-transporting ATPase subunit epsilon
MRLKVLVPTEVLINESVVKVIAEAENGAFCIEPRHIDFVAALVAGLLSYVDEEGKEQFLAIDEGTLVKCGPEVLVSARNVVRGTDLEHLKEVVRKQFRGLDERERMARTALARLEAGVIRRFIELEEMR